MTHTFVFERQLNRLDALHYHLGEHPNANVAMCMVATLDRHVAPEIMRAGFAAVAEEIPRFQDRLRPVPGDLAPPVWEADPTFDIWRHFDTISLSPDAESWEMLGHVDAFQSEPFAPGRPPWSVLYVARPPRGGVVVLKLHHVLSDGTALALMLSRIFMREALGDAGADVRAVASGAPASLVREAVRFQRHAVRESLTTTARTVLRSARRPTELRVHATEVRDYAVGPRRWTVADHAPARRSAFARIPLETWRDVARSRNGGVNELYLAVAAATLRRYLAVTGADDGQPLAFVMPIDTRSTQEQQDGGNVTGAGVLMLAGSDAELTDLRSIHNASRIAQTAAGDAPASVVDSLLALCPGAVQRRALFRRFSTKDALATNVIIPLSCGLHAAQAEMVHILPPVIGTPVSFALAGYDDAVHLAANMDLGLIDSPVTLERTLADLLHELFGSDAVTMLARVPAARHRRYGASYSAAKSSA